ELGDRAEEALQALEQRLRLSALRDGAVDLGVDLVEGVDDLGEDVLDRVAARGLQLDHRLLLRLDEARGDELVQDLRRLELAEVRLARDGGDVARAVDEMEH